ncbi:MAG TPA: UTP--glucose-1-phosphate uridylyltransferase [Alphaproteobacteria bacterium]|nr:UTP--glucose-1-phosphate uridylyltransferase [Alphaproteobacteria bacterium]|tara:strand:+ start:571 stop:1446 length:876 start_codon:yes stop_codon:yes gene_type:complete
MRHYRKIKKAVFPIAGFGTRFLPITKSVPKEMLPIINKPLISWALEEASSSGIEEFIFVVGSNTSLLKDYFSKWPALKQKLKKDNQTILLREINKIEKFLPKIKFVNQKSPLGLGHAIWCARKIIGDDFFAVILPDDLILAKNPCLKQMIAAHKRVGGNLVAVEKVPAGQVNRYGILDPAFSKGNLIKVKRLVEKPKPKSSPSNLAIIGRYILSPAIFSFLRKKQKGVGGEIQITDAISSSLQKIAFHGFRFNGSRFDCGNEEGYLEASLAFSYNTSRKKKSLRKIIRKYL